MGSRSHNKPHENTNAKTTPPTRPLTTQHTQHTQHNTHNTHNTTHTTHTTQHTQHTHAHTQRAKQRDANRLPPTNHTKIAPNTTQANPTAT